MRAKIIGAIVALGLLCGAALASCPFWFNYSGGVWRWCFEGDDGTTVRTSLRMDSVGRVQTLVEYPINFSGPDAQRQSREVFRQLVDAIIPTLPPGTQVIQSPREFASFDLNHRLIAIQRTARMEAGTKRPTLLIVAHDMNESTPLWAYNVAYDMNSAGKVARLLSLWNGGDANEPQDRSLTLIDVLDDFGGPSHWTWTYYPGSVTPEKADVSLGAFGDHVNQDGVGWLWSIDPYLYWYVVGFLHPECYVEMKTWDCNPVMMRLGDYLEAVNEWHVMESWCHLDCTGDDVPMMNVAYVDLVCRYETTLVDVDPSQINPEIICPDATMPGLCATVTPFEWPVEPPKRPERIGCGRWECQEPCE